eukprot:15137896-Ditylum_brightwellii.AAC.1
MEDMDTTYSDNFKGKVRIGSTTTLTGSSVSYFPLCLIPQSNAGTGVHINRHLDDETIFVETCYIPVGVSKGDLIGVQPDLTLSTFEEIYRKALLK